MAALAAALDDANQWRRTTALRLIDERQDPDAGKVLHEQLRKSKYPEGYIAVLHALANVDALMDADLMQALGNEHPQVRRHALRLSETRLNKSADVRQKALSLLTDSDPAVQFQLALSLGECQDAAAMKAIAEILRRSSNSREISDAALTSIEARAGAVLAQLLMDKA